MFKKSLLTLLVFSMMLICSFCFAQSDGDHSEKPCKLSFSSMQGLPDMALRGTDIVKISSFKNSLLPLKIRYSAEMGGARLDLQINIEVDNKVITRAFQEPGAKKHIRQYPDVCIHNGLFSASGIKGMIVEGGVLLFEKESGIDSIPNDVWIFYTGPGKMLR